MLGKTGTDGSNDAKSNTSARLLHVARRHDEMSGAVTPKRDSSNLKIDV